MVVDGANKLRIEHRELLERLEQDSFAYNETRLEADRLLQRAANFSFLVNGQLRQLQGKFVIGNSEHLRR